MGRNRKYRNAAERQKAYRDRQKFEKEALDLAFHILEKLSASADALRNLFEAMSAKGERPVLLYRSCAGGDGHFQLMVNGLHRMTYSAYLYLYMLRTNQLVEVKRTFAGIEYQLLPLPCESEAAQ
jgi:hypothetical protein